jgi:hypothetical protein
MAETIAKLDAAKRQLAVAIRLFFNYADPVAIHTLAAAAYQILYDLSKGHGVIGVVKGNPNVRKDKRAEWERIANQAQNFFKHADRDPLGKFNFEPEITCFFLFDAVSLYAQMTNQPFLEGTVYLSWFTVKYDHFLVAGAFKDYISTIKQKGLDPDDFNFIQLFLQQLAT